MQTLLGYLLYVLPKNILSYWTGQLVHVRWPSPLRGWFIRLFVKKYSINMDEAEHPIDSYPSIGDLFIRRLKEGIRPIAGDCFAIHPCDSELTSFGAIEEGTLLQAKGRRYEVSEFLGDEEMAQRMQGGQFYTYYLCPTDYHRVHSSVEGVVKKVIHIPGKLWPVNDWSVRSIDRLFAINERMVIEIETERGYVVLVMVGATNVGKISLSFDSELISNDLEHRAKREKSYQDPVKLFKGSELGIFHMGSTVIALYSNKMNAKSAALESGPVKLGEKFFE